jgi:hypothetical protein
VKSVRRVSIVLVVALVLMVAALAVPAGSLADLPRGFTPTFTPTTTSTPTATRTPTLPSGSPPPPPATPTPGPLLPETGEADGTDAGVLLAFGVMVVLAFPLVILTRSARTTRREKASRATPE